MRRHTRPGHAPLVPEIALRLADALTPIWEASEAWLEREGVEPPFWAFAWPGGQAIARHLLDHPELVRGRCVLDFAAGCGIAAIAAALSGAARITASELDPIAIAAIADNAAAAGVAVETILGDVTDAAPRWDVVLCGDVCYAAPMTGAIMPWLRAAADAGADVILADPGRAYLPRDELAAFGPVYDVPTSRELEDREIRSTRLYRLRAHAGPA